MTFWINIFISILISFANNEVKAEDCEQFPAEININLEQCCSFANISDHETENKIQDMAKEAASQGKNNFEMACKVAQTVFKEMKLTKANGVDRDAYAKMIDTKIAKDVDFWKQPLKNGFDQCQANLLTDVSKVTDLFSKHPFNIKKEDCDAQYLVMFMCLHLDSFVNCPDKAWKVVEEDSNHKPCNTVKTWFEKCGKDLNALKKIVLKGTGIN